MQSEEHRTSCMASVQCPKGVNRFCQAWEEMWCVNCIPFIAKRASLISCRRSQLQLPWTNCHWTLCPLHMHVPVSSARPSCAPNDNYIFFLRPKPEEYLRLFLRKKSTTHTRRTSNVAWWSETLSKVLVALFKQTSFSPQEFCPYHLTSKWAFLLNRRQLNHDDNDGSTTHFSRSALLSAARPKMMETIWESEPNFQKNTGCQPHTEAGNFFFCTAWWPKGLQVCTGWGTLLAFLLQNTLEKKDDCWGQNNPSKAWSVLGRGRVF